MESQDSKFDHLFTLNISADKFNAALRINPDPECESITRDSLRAFIDAQGIADRCVLDDEISRLTDETKADPTNLHEMVVARGKPAVFGRNSYIQYAEHIESQIEAITKRQTTCDHESTKGIEDKEQAIDFHDQSPFLIVSKGEHIGQIMEEVAGEDGFQLTGEPILAVQEIVLFELDDDSFSVSSDGNFQSLIDGQLIYDAKDVKVLDTLDISNSVDFTTGNIDFPSDVIIHDGVHDQFTVKSQGNIEIHKLVQAAFLDSAKDIELKSGMAGREIGTITTGGNLAAKYIDGVHAKIGGECEITKEITNCHLSIAGSIQSPLAAVRGGELSASNGGVVSSIGSEQGVETDVIIGALPQIEEKIKTADGLHAQIKVSITKHTQELEMYKGSMGKPSETQKEQIREMESEIALFTKQQAALEDAISRLGQVHTAHTARRFTVRSAIYAKSELWLPGYRAYFEKDVKGELIIDLDEHSEPVIIRNDQSAPLNTVAKVRSDNRVLIVTPPPPELEAADTDDERSGETQLDESGIDHLDQSDDLQQAA